MEAMNRFKKGDLFIVLLIALIALSTLIWSHFNVGGKQGDSLIAVITRDGKVTNKIDLNKVQEPQYIKFEDGIHLTVLAEKGKIRVLDADCPDKICVKYGWLTKPGDQAICMPSKTIVKIEGEGNRVSLLPKRLIINE
jgi:hypothetical protein